MQKFLVSFLCFTLLALAGRLLALDIAISNLYDLKVEQMTDPQGIDIEKPSFSWKIRSDFQGQEQLSYRIRVNACVPHLTDDKWPLVWDSGKVESNKTGNVIYGGEPLKPGTKYVWSLALSMKEGGEIKSVATFSTGLRPEDWKGEWIGLDEVASSDKKELKLDLKGSKWVWTKPDANVPVGKSTFRKTFDLPEKIESAALAFTADNGHVVFVNGKKVSSGTNFKNAVQTDITAAVNPGKNTIAVQVANEGDAPNPAGLFGVISVRFEDGKTFDIRTDKTWKGVDGVPTDSSSVDFDDSGWKNAVETADAGGGPWGEITIGSSRPSPPARYLRKSFEISNKEIVRATAYISGLGYYELYINGTKIGDHVLDPVLTDYDKRVPYVTYDIPVKDFNVSMADFTVAPEGFYSNFNNVVGVVLGNGRYYAPRTTDPTFTKTYGFPKLRFQLVLEYKNGTSGTIVSDNFWALSTDGPIRGNNDYDGEICDARKSLIEWNMRAHDNPRSPSFDESLSDGRWRNVEIVEAPKGELVAQMMPPMKVTGELKPKSLKEVKPGVWVFDFGQNFVGRCRLKLPKTDRGTEIMLRHAETLQTEGEDAGMLYLANLRGAMCRDIYYTLGFENETYEPTFTYHGFRYAELTGFPGTPDLETLTGCVINTDLKIVGKFECSNETITRFAKNIEWGTRGNYLSIPTDCPQRDERQGWQGDRAGESLGEMFMFDNYTLYKKWLIDIEDSQREDGNLSDVCPNYWPMYGSNVTWPSAFTFVPGHIYNVYGDRRPIERHYPAMKKWLIGHMGQFVKDGLIDKDNYGDWCVPPENEHLIHSQDPKRRTDKTLLATSYYIYNLKLLALYAGLLGETEDEAAYLKKAEEMTAAFNKRFYDAEKGQYDNGTQTSCVLPLAFEIVPKGEEQKVFDTLIKNIETVTDYHIGTGLVGGQWLGSVLSKYGRDDIYYRFATNKTYPSWGYMLESGATTVWELWNGNTADPAMNSGNHVMLIGDLVIWYYTHLGGINGGYDRDVVFSPHVVGDLTFVKCSYDSPRGIIESNWELKNGKFTYKISVPVGSKARVEIPTSAESKDEITAPKGAEFKEIKDGRAIFKAPSGYYEFTAPYLVERTHSDII